MRGHLTVQNLGKAFRSYPSRWARLTEWLMPQTRRHELAWVLRNVNFSVTAGESVGIIGRNGAGKSTLLKLITGTSQPTEGLIRSGGRISALLELGMGFHPDFTGRENVFMMGQLMGLTTEQLSSAMPQIEDFAEIGRYIDEPLRTYSSGMQVRLAFSVATAFRPDTLIVDEALSVGDMYFQHKCYARIRQFRREGMTLLFVSHDIGAIKSLCDRAILLEKGTVAADDSPDRVLDLYNALIAERENAATWLTAGATESSGMRSGDSRVRLLSVEVCGGNESGEIFRVGTPIRISMRFTKEVEVADLTAGFLIRDRLGNDVYGTNTWHLAKTLLRDIPVGKSARLDFYIPALNIGPGSYSVTAALHSDITHLGDNYDWWDKACVFQVIRGDEIFFSGVAHLPGVDASVEVET